MNELISSSIKDHSKALEHINQDMINSAIEL